jgi:hypothetical protein
MNTIPWARGAIVAFAALPTWAAATCWDTLDQIKGSAAQATLSAVDKAEMDRLLSEAEGTRASNDGARCEELVAQMQTKLGMQPGVPDNALADVSEEMTESREPPHGAGVSAGELPATPSREEPAAFRSPPDISQLRTTDLVGKPVRSGSGETIAQVEAIVRDDGVPRRGYAVLTFEDPNGVGDRRVVVGLDQLHLEPDGAVRTPVRTSADLAGFLEYDGAVYERYEGAIAEITTD